MADLQEFPQTEFNKVHELIDLVKERIEEDPDNKEWLLDFNLPDLYLAIGGLYAALGETDRLERTQATIAQE